MVKNPIVSKLAEYSTCDVADALQKLGYPEGGYLAHLRMLSPEYQAGSTKVVGQVYTVKYVHKHEECPDLRLGPGEHYIDSLPEGHILFLSAPSNPPYYTNALYGGLLSLRSQTLGAVGTIVDGSIRDLSEHRALKYPVWAMDIGVASPNPVYKVGGINVPIIYRPSSIPPPDLTSLSAITSPHSITISPHDYVIADLNGVVHIPHDLVDKVLALIPSQVAADEAIAEELNQFRRLKERGETKEGEDEISFGNIVKEKRKDVLKVEDL